MHHLGATLQAVAVASDEEEALFPSRAPSVRTDLVLPDPGAIAAGLMAASS